MRLAPNLDTIAAIATPMGAGGIGVVRISGAKAGDIAKHLLGVCPPNRLASYLPFLDAKGHVIDRGIALFFKSPHSYTGEDVLELQGHGGTAVMQILLSRCIESGARLAKPGEFTERAFLNDKIDLAQAEAVADLINASTAEAAKSAMLSLSGYFSNKINELLKDLIDLRMYIEACLDFPEEDIDFITKGKVEEKLSNLTSRMDEVIASARQGHLLREGLTVVLVGQPNVGKSSLLNQLVGDDHAIVTSIPGTTRDPIKSSVQIDGVPLHVIDTAGLRDTSDEIEKMGIEKTWISIEKANIALFLVDAGRGIANYEKTILKRIPQDVLKVWVHNKIDLLPKKTSSEIIDGEHHVFISAKKGEGISNLKATLLKIAGVEYGKDGNQGIFMARQRHLDALNQVGSHLSEAKEHFQSPELLAEELRQAQTFLASITGEFTPDDLLGEIFSRFCIGK
ncbi:MAG: tRNA uridine-5-carboxymethylaminomethyl(34) synthesis GTPase MnmE [Candidatus Methylopumilus sp.]|nr:tRNA uridine-5-carboxymethylaminomethyl(34) synthesis GTPase MnmE [Candidatus Methylopumilus sp.]